MTEPEMQKLRGKYYSMLMQFTGGTVVTHSRLLRLRPYDEAAIKTALDLGLISPVPGRSERTYCITEKGRHFRDD